MKQLNIGFIGNFQVPYTTENERKWSFEKLGHKVNPFQENRTTKEQLLTASKDLDMLVYSHTHDPSYVIEGLKDVFDLYRQAGIPTVSAHLDLWVGLQRQEDMGKEATWFAEHVFMADCSPEAVSVYQQLSVNWHWLKAGVVERDCYIKEPDHKKFPYDIVFTGSKGYHPEYKWRPQMIDFLQKTYGTRFGLFGNDGIRVVRGDDLNTLYSSAKVVVGDSCFSGRARYTSDRYFEVRGRGGFLVNPVVDGMDNIGIGNYEAGNFDDLKRVIDYFLINSEEREAMRRAGYEHVRSNETYTNRAKEILSVVFP